MIIDYINMWIVVQSFLGLYGIDYVLTEKMETPKKLIQLGNRSKEARNSTSNMPLKIFFGFTYWFLCGIGGCSFCFSFWWSSLLLTCISLYVSCVLIHFGFLYASFILFVNWLKE